MAKAKKAEAFKLEDGRAKMTLRGVRLSFPTLVKAEAFEPGAKAKFGAMLVMEAGHPQLDAVKEAIVAVAKEEWGPRKGPTTVRGQQHKPLRPGKEEWGHPEGSAYVQAKADRRPVLVDRNRNKIEVDEIDDLFFPGAVVNAHVSAYPGGGKNKGVFWGLNAIQFVKDDGFRYGGGSVDTDEVFEDLGDDEELGGSLDDVVPSEADGGDDEDEDEDDPLAGL